jgi:hypothetical protein
LAVLTDVFATLDAGICAPLSDFDVLDVFVLAWHWLAMDESESDVGAHFTAVSPITGKVL